jgi:nickel/cobalt transporter (NicO) family protein
LPLTRTVIRAALAASIAAALLPAIALAHPLGNFTINHYAGVRIEPDRILLDVVIDQAEIPTFQARLDLDTDEDGLVSDEEIAAGRTVRCEDLRGSLDLRVGQVAETLTLTEAGLAFPPGAGGLSTMRQVCGFRVDLAAPMTRGTTVTFADTSYAERLGWREIVVIGSGVSVAAADGGAVPTASVSERLTAYPSELLTRPLAQASMSVVATLGGPTLAPFDVADASPVGGAGTDVPGESSAPGAVASPVPPAVSDPVAVAGVPGGVGTGDLPSIFRSTDLTPVVLLVSLLTAAALGAGHALTPGHGKTLMAAYLVGTRGRPLHAVGLGLSVSVSHTVGILVLAALVLGAQGVLAPDLVVRAAPVVAAISIVVIGGWMLLGELRRRRVASMAAAGGGHDHEHAHESAHPHDDAQAPEHDHDHPHPHDHAHGHDHAHEPAHTQGHDEPAHTRPHEPAPGEHSHGGIRHSHVPPAGSTITWRSLFVLGLAGGLIPSTSALLILLGSIAADRPAFGFVLVAAFGVGMAAVMSGIGLAMVFARGRLERVGSGSPLGRVTTFVPLAAAVLVFTLGLYLTAQAIGGAPTL